MGEPATRPVTARYTNALRASMLGIVALFAGGAGWLDRSDGAHNGHVMLWTTLTVAALLALELRRRIVLAGEALRVVGPLWTRRYEVARVRTLRRREVLEPTGTEIEFDDGFVTFLPDVWANAAALRTALLRTREAAPYRAVAALPVSDVPIVLEPTRPFGVRGLIADFLYLALSAALLLLGAAVMLLGWLEFRGVARAAWCVTDLALLGGGLYALISALQTARRIHARGALVLTREGLRVGPVGAQHIPWREVDAVGARRVRLRDGASFAVSRDEASVIRAAQARFSTPDGAR